ncbi:MAG: aldo/keto reductase [Tannerellaceae bacterium]|jgi:aryl-alcohol dehydrogenase (NADP+)|nr:aldo/keto reductase [Tannerellaceae bacterium]
MEYKILTGTGIKVSRICLGTMTFGDQLQEKDAIEATAKAVDLGINFIDTANGYMRGESEVIVGKAVKAYRDKLIIATKGGYPTCQDGDMNDRGLSRRNLISSLDNSLKRLGLDYIDIYYMHCPIYDVPPEETYDTLSSFVRAGKVRYIGTSNSSSWQVCEALWKNDVRNGVPPVVSQVPYNLLARGIENELVPFLQTYKLGLVVYNPLAGGLLTGKHKLDSVAPDSRYTGRFSKMYKDRYWNEESFGAVDKLAVLAQEHGITIAELAMRWVASQPFVDSVLTGISKIEQLEQNVNAISHEPLCKEILDTCDNLWYELSGKRTRYNR